MKALKKKLANFAKIEKLTRIYIYFFAITKTTLNANKYRKNKKNKFRNNCDFLKGKVKKVIWKPAKFAKIAKVTRIFYSAAATTTKHANKYRKNNRNKLSKSSDLYKGEWQRHLFSSDSVKFQTGVISVKEFLSCVKCSQRVPGRSTISFEEFNLSSLYNLADQVLL